MSEHHQTCFKTLKKQISSSPVLAIIICCEFHAGNIGEACSQVIDREEIVPGFYSRKLAKEEQGRSNFEL